MFLSNLLDLGTFVMGYLDGKAGGKEPMGWEEGLKFSVGQYRRRVKKGK